MTGKPLLTPDVPRPRPPLRPLIGYGAREERRHGPRVPERLRALAALKSAVMQGCEMCQDIGSFEARANGRQRAQLLDLHRYRESPHFDETERLVLDLAVGMTARPSRSRPSCSPTLREHFDATRSSSSS